VLTPNSPLRTATVAFFLLWASIAHAEAPQGSIRLLGSWGRHSGSQSVPLVEYRGSTPNDVRLSGNYFGAHWLGFAASVREVGISVSGGGNDGQATLFAVQLGPAARYSRGRFHLWASVGYEFGKRVAFTQLLPPELSPMKVHSLWVSGTVRWEPLSWLHPELRLDWPISFYASAREGKATASSVSGALAMLFPVAKTGRFAWSALVEGGYARESATLPPNTSLSSSISRVGIGLEWAILPPPPPPPPPPAPPAPEVTPPPPAPILGDLDVAVVDKKTGQPIPYANLFVAGRDARTSQQGKVLLQGVRPGRAMVDVEADGYLPGHEEVEIVQGALTSLTVSLPAVERVGYATLSGILRSARTGDTLSGTVQIFPGPRTIKVEKDGVFFVQLQEGRYRVVISAKGHTAQSKNLALKEGDEAIYNVDLHPARSRK
jgi:hypothetical protein